MKLTIALCTLVSLAACGADGPPVRPSLDTTVRIGTGGISTSTSTTLSSGPVSVGLQL